MEPSLLCGVALFQRESSVVMDRRYAPSRERTSQLDCACTAARIDDSRASDCIQGTNQFLLLVLHRTHRVHQVAALKAHAVAVGHQPEAQLLADIIGHARRCGCSERKDGHSRKQLAYFVDLSIGRTEVVPPLRNAVRFIDS